MRDDDPCSYCERSTTGDDDAIYFIVPPKGLTLDDLPRGNARAALAAGFGFGVLCAECQKEGYTADNVRAIRAVA